jgi:hypothetical protein
MSYLIEPVSSVLTGVLVLNGVYALKGGSMPPIMDTLTNAGLLGATYMGAQLVNAAAEPITKQSETLRSLYNEGGATILNTSAQVAMYVAAKSYLTGQPPRMEDAIVAFFVNTSTYEVSIPVYMLAGAVGIN